MVDSLQNKFHHEQEKEADESNSEASDEVDLFSVPMNSAAFMAKIAE